MPKSMILRRLRRIEEKLDDVLNNLEDSTMEQDDDYEDESEADIEEEDTEESEED